MSVRDVAALEREVTHSDDRQIIDIRAAALNQTWILAALDALAYQFRQHGCFRQHGRRGHGLPLARGVLDGVDNVLIAGAPAEIPRDAFANLTFGWLRVVFEQTDGGDDHAGRAESALQPMMLPECVLQRMQLAV